MKTPYKNIYTVLRYHRIIVFILLAGAFLTCGYAVWSVHKIHNQALRNAFVINTDGAVIPLEYQPQKESFEVEALAHLELFHKYFYNLDAGNHKKNIGKALWLGNRSVDELYQQKRSEGIYNRLMQYGLVQKVSRIDSKITERNGKNSFETIVLFEINRGSQIDQYRLKTTGNLIPVDRSFPHNPHGLLITNFYEVSLQKLKE